MAAALLCLPVTEVLNVPFNVDAHGQKLLDLIFHELN